MNQVAHQKTPLTGLVYEDPDPAAQLIGGQLRAAGKRFMSGSDGQSLLAVIDRCLVTSQHIYLADISTFSRAVIPVDIIVRRPRGGETHSEWQTGLQMLGRCLDQIEDANVRCHALTRPAALAAEGILGRNVCALEPLPRIANREVQAAVDGDILCFVDGSETSNMPLCDANWWRMRRKTAMSETSNSPPDVQDLIAFFNGMAPKVGLSYAQAKTYLFIVSNGVGLGHLSRLLAVADKLKGRIVFWSYSQAAQLIAQRGYTVIPRMTAEHLEASADAWNEWEAADLTNLIGQNHVDAIVYDGSSPPMGLMDALKRPELGDTAFVWVRRGMWHVDATATSLALTHRCDLVVEPNDLAGASDIGPTRTTEPEYRGQCKFLQVAPVVATQPDQMLSRRKARSLLRHRSLRPLCLINLGGDTLGDQAPLVALLERIAPKEHIRFLWLRSPFAVGVASGLGAIEEISHFPISPLLNGFDGIISAAGYNSFHEVLSLCRAPVLFAPNRHARLDDQYARAKYAADQGWARVLEPDATNSLEAQLGDFLDVVRRKSSNREPAKIADGAASIASAIFDLTCSDTGGGYS